ncbi:MAG: hypothetical protein KC766_38910 [Myxococcales bacterium]|nr:hypothetical protein [Myxococcales bacterium]
MIRTRAATFMLCGLFAGSTLESVARAAESCPVSSRPVIVLSASVKPPDQLVADALREHLKTQLADRGIDLCVETAGKRAPIGTVTLIIDRPDNGPVTALVRIGDDVTDKRVERTMDLTNMPADARALAVSSSADELLRASWAELMIADAPPPKTQPPREVMAAVQSSLVVPEPVPRGAIYQLGVLGSAEVSKDMLSLGPAAFGSYYAADQAGLTLRLQFGFTPGKDTDNGSVSASSQGAQIGFAYAANPISDSVGLGFETGAGVRRVAFSARANRGVVEASTSDWSADLVAGPWVWLQAGPLRLRLGADLLYALRPTSARDTGEVVLSNEGIGGRVSLGVLLHDL